MDRAETRAIFISPPIHHLWSGCVPQVLNWAPVTMTWFGNRFCADVTRLRWVTLGWGPVVEGESDDTLRGERLQEVTEEEGT